MSWSGGNPAWGGRAGPLCQSGHPVGDGKEEYPWYHVLVPSAISSFRMFRCTLHVGESSIGCSALADKGFRVVFNNPAGSRERGGCFRRLTWPLFPQRLRSTCPLPVHPTTAMSSDEPAWATRDQAVNTWLAENADTACLMALAALPEPDRRSKAWTTMTKHQRGVLTGNPSAYIMGILRREAEGPYGRDRALVPGQACGAMAPWLPRPLMEGPQLVSAPLLRGIASPQSNESSRSTQARPDWVLNAWAVRQRPAALFRVLSKALGDTVGPLIKLPDQVQMSCCMYLLMIREAQADPAKFINDFVAAFRAMPVSGPPSGVGSGAAASRAPGNRFVVIHMGQTSGYELHALNLATTALKEEGISSEILEIVACTRATAWTTVVEEFMNSMRGSHAAQHMALGDSPQVLRGKVGSWMEQGAKVLMLLTLPLPGGTSFGQTGNAPSFHGRHSRDLWVMLSVIEIVLALGTPVVSVGCSHLSQLRTRTSSSSTTSSARPWTCQSRRPGCPSSPGLFAWLRRSGHARQHFALWLFRAPMLFRSTPLCGAHSTPPRPCRRPCRP